MFLKVLNLLVFSIYFHQNHVVTAQNSSNAQFICNHYKKSSGSNIDSNKAIEVVILEEEIDIICGIIHNAKTTFPRITVPNVKGSYLNVTIFNSTWSKSYFYDALENSRHYHFSINSNDIFEPSLSHHSSYRRHLNTNLRWVVRLEARHFDYSYTFKKLMVVIHFYSDMILQTKWGDQATSLSSNLFESAISTKKLIIFHKPCQPGCILHFLPGNPKTYFWSTCIGWFDKEITFWYTWNCPLVEKSFCKTLVIYDGLLTYNRTLLVTNYGLLLSQNLAVADEKMIAINFHQINMSFLSFTIDWKTAQLSTYPICSVVEQVPAVGIVIMRTFTSEGLWMVLSSSEPFTSWIVLPRLSSSSSPRVFVYDSQVHTLVSVQQDQTTYVEVFTPFGDSKTTLYPPFHFTSECLGLPQMLLLSNHFLYTSVGGCLWLSLDGGNHFHKLYTFPNENINRLIGCDLDGAVAIVTSRDRVFWTKSGMSGVHLVFDRIAASRAIVTFDPVCNIVLLNNESALASPPSVRVSRTSWFLTQDCSVKLNTIQETLFVNFLQYPGQLLEFKVEATFKHDNSPMRRSKMAFNFGNPRLFRVNSRLYQISSSRDLLIINVQTNFIIEALTSLSIYLINVDTEICPTSSLTFIVLARCCFSLRFRFNYSSLVTDGLPPFNLTEYTEGDTERTRNLLIPLPENYRAPSSVAISIPLTSNVYNVNPATFNQTRNASAVPVPPAKLKSFCQGAKVRSDCKCTPALKFSSLEKHSDCREKVYRVLFNTPYRLHIALTSSDVTDAIDPDLTSKFYVFLREINGRDEGVYIVEDSDSPCVNQPDGILCGGLSSNKDSLMRFMTSGISEKIFGAKTVTLTFAGSGLFHFRITLAHGFFFCNFYDELQVFVANPPLPFPVGTLIRIAIAIAMCLVLAFFYSREVIHATRIGTNLRLNMVRHGNKIAAASTSLTVKRPAFTQ